MAKTSKSKILHGFLESLLIKKLTWKPHIDKVVEKCNKRMNILRVLSGTRWGSSKTMLLIVYKAMIRSVIDYGSIAYDIRPPTALSKDWTKSKQRR